MLKAKELQDSAWDGNDDFMIVRKEKSEWVASGNAYQIVDKSATNLQKKLKKDGFTHVGWE